MGLKRAVLVWAALSWTKMDWTGQHQLGVPRLPLCAMGGGHHTSVGCFGSAGPMEESEEDGEDNEVFLEQLMVQTGQAVPRQELEEQYTVLEELGSGTYGRVVLTEPRDGGEELWGGPCPDSPRGHFTPSIPPSC